MDNVSFLLQTAFVLTTFLTVFLFFRATASSRNFLIIIGLWMAVQFGIGMTDFYTNTDTKPPRFVLMVVPTLVFIIALFFTAKGRAFIDQLNLRKLTLVHIVRIPVEIVLYYLFVAKAIPEIMTFAGQNFDILAGLTAPFIYIMAFRDGGVAKQLLLFWNIACLLLLFNIIITAILSTPTDFQQFGLDQPNQAIMHFPFNWLASVVVPIVLFSHFAALRLLISKKPVDQIDVD